MNQPAIDALKRAQQRIAAHGWRQGPRPKSFKGYSLVDAIIGPVAEFPDGAGEKDALSFAFDAALHIYPPMNGEDDIPSLAAWNDAPHRTLDQVRTVLNVAIGYAEVISPVIAPPPSNEGEKTDVAPQALFSMPTLSVAPEVSRATPPPELVAKASALGYEGAETWDEARLRAAIASASVTDRKLAELQATVPTAEEAAIKPMPDPLKGQRESPFSKRTA